MGWASISKTKLVYSPDLLYAHYITGYGYYYRRAPPLDKFACALDWGVVLTHMCYPTEHSTISAREANKP